MKTINMKSVFYNSLLQGKNEPDEMYRNRMIFAGYHRGYWFIRESDKKHVFLAEYKQQAKQKLEKTCDKYLSDKNGWNYSVRYCFGFDCDGNVAWKDFSEDWN